MRRRLLLLAALILALAAGCGAKRSPSRPALQHTRRVMDLEWLGAPDKLLAQVSEMEGDKEVASSLWRLSLTSQAAEELPLPSGFAHDPQRCGPGERFALELMDKPPHAEGFKTGNIALRDRGATGALTNLGGWNASPVCTPAGNEIAFLHLEAGKRGVGVLLNFKDPAYGIYVVDATTRRVRPLVVQSVGSSFVVPRAWSPDGTRLLFQRITPTAPKVSRRDLWIVNRDGSGATALTFCGDAQARATWSPDGRSVLFVRETPYDPVCDLWRADVATHNLSPVFSWKQLHEPFGARWIAPSPDGKKVLSVDPTRALWLIDVKTAASTRLSQGVGGGYSWSPDSKGIAYVRNQTEVWVTTVGGPPKKLWAAPPP